MLSVLGCTLVDYSVSRTGLQTSFAFAGLIRFVEAVVFADVRSGETWIRPRGAKIGAACLLRVSVDLSPFGCTRQARVGAASGHWDDVMRYGVTRDWFWPAA